LFPDEALFNLECCWEILKLL